MPKLVQIGRNSFARFDILREVVRTSLGCKNCSHRRKTGKLFRYYHSNDTISNKPKPVPNLFCSKSCCDEFNRS